MHHINGKGVLPQNLQRSDPADPKMPQKVLFLHKRVEIEPRKKQKYPGNQGKIVCRIKSGRLKAEKGGKQILV